MNYLFEFTNVKFFFRETSMTIASNLKILLWPKWVNCSQWKGSSCVNQLLYITYYSSLANQVKNEKERKWESKLDCNSNAIIAYFIINLGRSFFVFWFKSFYIAICISIIVTLCASENIFFLLFYFIRNFFGIVYFIQSKLTSQWVVCLIFLIFFIVSHQIFHFICTFFSLNVGFFSFSIYFIGVSGSHCNMCIKC